MLDVHSANYISREGLQRRQPGYIHGPINLSDADGYARNNRRTSNYAAGNNRASTAPETVVAFDGISLQLKTGEWGGAGSAPNLAFPWRSRLPSRKKTRAGGFTADQREMKFPRAGYPIFQLDAFDRFRSVTRDRPRTCHACETEERKKARRKAATCELTGERNRKLAGRATPIAI